MRGVHIILNKFTYSANVHSDIIYCGIKCQILIFRSLAGVGSRWKQNKTPGGPTYNSKNNNNNNA